MREDYDGKWQRSTFRSSSRYYPNGDGEQEYLAQMGDRVPLVLPIGAYRRTDPVSVFSPVGNDAMSGHMGDVHS